MIISIFVQPIYIYIYIYTLMLLAFTVVFYAHKVCASFSFFFFSTNEHLSSCLIRLLGFFCYAIIIYVLTCTAFIKLNLSRIQIIGTPNVVYVSEETPMLLYLNTHVAIDQIRHKAQLNNTKGPRVSHASMIAHLGVVRKLTLVSLSVKLGCDIILCLLNPDIGYLAHNFFFM